MAESIKINEDNRIGSEVAVIGMAGRFPGARDIHEFWNNLKNGVESVSFYSDEELEEQGIHKVFENLAVEADENPELLLMGHAAMQSGKPNQREMLK